ncbi:NAD(P)H-hydrate dehydratase [Virgibacillus sp. MG-45]|uniref:NAD(P)H-hydrate dehydratase n=1 Tax=Virgibacillus sp. MG-45 TaxID=3102791 RepID=UPI002ED8E8CE
MYIVTAKEMYEIDHYTMHEIGYGNLLMENAGRAVAERIILKVKKTDSIGVLVGGGNNGGDGFVIARTLHNSGYHVKVMQVVPDEKMAEATKTHRRLFVRCGGLIEQADKRTNWQHFFEEWNIVVDAMVGIGVKDPLRDPISMYASMINERAQVVISVDIPSGLPADEGVSEFLAVQADYTIVVGAVKVSAYIQHTAPYYGQWEVVSIGHPQQAYTRSTNRLEVTKESFCSTMPKRKKDAHKGNHGKGLIIGGSDDMPGALALSVRAALRSGTGLLTAASTEKAIDRIASYTVEAMYKTLPSQNGSLINNRVLSFEPYDALAIGIGMGRQKETEALVEQAIREAACPIIVDGDGIFHLKGVLSDVKHRTYPTIITPHPGEMARLLDLSIQELLLQPFRYSVELAKAYHMFVVLKAPYTIITAPDGRQAVNTTGNPGLAKGGSGDVLTGILLAMVMQQQGIFQALCNACFVHGMSADLQMINNHSTHDLLASDVVEGIANVYRTFSC